MTTKERKKELNMTTEERNGVIEVMSHVKVQNYLRNGNQIYSNDRKLKIYYNKQENMTILQDMETLNKQFQFGVGKNIIDSNNLPILEWDDVKNNVNIDIDELNKIIDNAEKNYKESPDTGEIYSSPFDIIRTRDLYNDIQKFE